MFFKIFVLLGIINICLSSPASVAQTPRPQPQYYYPPQYHENDGIVENIKQYVSKPYFQLPPQLNNAMRLSTIHVPSDSGTVSIISIY